MRFTKRIDSSTNTPEGLATETTTLRYFKRPATLRSNTIEPLTFSTSFSKELIFEKTTNGKTSPTNVLKTPTHVHGGNPNTSHYSPPISNPTFKGLADPYDASKDPTNSTYPDQVGIPTNVPKRPSRVLGGPNPSTNGPAISTNFEAFADPEDASEDTINPTNPDQIAACLQKLTCIIRTIRILILLIIFLTQLIKLLFKILKKIVSTLLKMIKIILKICIKILVTLVFKILLKPVYEMLRKVVGLIFKTTKPIFFPIFQILRKIHSITLNILKFVLMILYNFVKGLFKILYTPLKWLLRIPIQLAKHILTFAYKFVILPPIEVCKFVIIAVYKLAKTLFLLSFKIIQITTFLLYNSITLLCRCFRFVIISLYTTAKIVFFLPSKIFNFILFPTFSFVKSVPIAVYKVLKTPSKQVLGPLIYQPVLYLVTLICKKCGFMKVRKQCEHSDIPFSIRTISENVPFSVRPSSDHFPSERRITQDNDPYTARTLWKNIPFTIRTVSRNNPYTVMRPSGNVSFVVRTKPNTCIVPPPTRTSSSTIRPFRTITVNGETSIKVADSNLPFTISTHSQSVKIIVNAKTGNCPVIIQVLPPGSCIR